MIRRFALRSFSARWAVTPITLLLLSPSPGGSQTWRDTLQHALVTGVGVSRDGIAGDSPGNAIVEQQIRFHLQNEKLRRETSGAPVAGTTFFVTTTEDTGEGSFRKALLDANTSPGKDLISFNIPPAGPKTITPLSKLPNIVDSVVIDGTTQPGFVDKPMIQLNFYNIGSYDGLDMYAGNSTVRGLVINGMTGGSAIVLWTGGNNIIEGNYIGTNLAGNFVVGNIWNGVWAKTARNRIGGTDSAARNVFSGNGYPSVAFAAAGADDNLCQGNYFGTDFTGNSLLGNLQEGVLVDFGSLRDTIGGTDPAARNIISGTHPTYGGISIAGHAPNSTGHVVVQGNYIGTDVTGTRDFGNGGSGVYILDAHDNIIGGVEPGARNILSGNELYGVALRGSFSINNTVQGNFIGTDTSGKVPLRNTRGVLIDLGASENLIGGTAAGEGNVISGNIGIGVVLRDTATHGNRIEGNLIGTNPDGVTALPNGEEGVWVINAPRNIIGGPTPAAGNVIAWSGRDGVLIEGLGAWGNKIHNNFIGTDTSATHKLGNGGRGVLITDATNNEIRYNRIFANIGLGIDLEPVGVTPNDSTDNDEGPNTLLNFPILDSATIGSSSIRIRGRLRGKPTFVYTLDFFRNDARHSSHFGEGQTFIGSASLPSGPDGKLDINVTFPAVVTPGQFITATATDADGNTSEFSRALCLADTDGDGILDCWESKDDGIDVNADNVIDLDLYAKGARPDHKDLFVEVDVMAGTFLQSGTIPLVRSAFARVKNRYIGNPDGMDGINLFIEYDPLDVEIPHALWAVDHWGEFFNAKKQFFGTDIDRLGANVENVLEAKRLVYRYCIFADRFGAGKHSGLSEGPSGMAGNDFMVTLGAFTAVIDSFQAGTFMHELGHTLGLQHGGADGDNYKTNYFSVMNYLWQAPHWAAQYQGIGWDLTYSTAALPTLDENQLHEAVGLNPQPGNFPIVIVPYNGPMNTIRQATLAPGVAVDWDGSGDSSGFSGSPVDLNFFDHPINTPSMGDILIGHADWPNLLFNFRNGPNFEDPTSSAIRLMAAGDSVPDEMTPEIYDYLQSLPPYGIQTPLNAWPTDPGENIPISTADYRQGSPVITTDGRGGAIIAYSSNTVPGNFPGDSSDVYVQHIDSLGRVQWRSNGLPICTAPGPQQPTSISSDGDGGAIIVWQDKRDGYYEVFAQRIDALGQTLWPADGAPVSLASNASLPPHPVVITVFGGGAIVAWRDASLGTYTVHAQRLDQAGSPVWPTGVVVGTTPATLRDTVVQMIGDDSGGAIIAWVDQRAGAGFQNHDIYAQRVGSDGAIQWAPEGIPLCNEPQEQDWPRIRRDGSGGAIAVWHDLRNVTTDDLYVQRVDANGQALWDSGGVPISVGWGGKKYPELATDGKGGAIIAWMDTRRLGYMHDVYAQRVNASGVVMWQNDGVAICETTMSSLHPGIVTDLNGGAVITFANRRGAATDIFAQRIDSSGATQWAKNGVPVCTAANDQWYPVIATDRAGGAIISWYDHRSETVFEGAHIYAQNITSTGGLGGDVVTAAEDRPPDGLPTDFSLAQNYPNPFNPITTIRYELPRASHVILKVYDVLGRVVTVLVDETQGAGGKSVEWNASRLSSGVYFYRLSAGEFVQARKMVLVK